MSDEPYSPIHVGRRLRVIRRAFGGISQADLARRTGLSASAVGNWEQGAQRPNLAAAKRIVDAFDLTLDYLFLGDMGRLSHKVAIAILEAERDENNKSSDKPD